MKKIILMVLPLLLLAACSPKEGTLSQNVTTSMKQAEPIEVEETSTYDSVKMNIYRDSLKIAGELLIPDNNQDVFPLVILSHGFRENMSNTKDKAISFVKKGFASFIYDFIGGGDSIQSDGKMTEMSVLTEAQDLNTIIDHFLEDERISSSHIFLMGQSQGGFVSTCVAANRNDIRGLLDFYPAFCIKDDAIAQYPNADQVPDPYQMTKMGVTLGKIFYTDVCSFDIYEVMANYQGDTLLLHGTNDNIVPVSYARRAAETIPNCTYIEIQGAGHGFSGQDNERAISASLELMMNNLD